MQSWKRVLKLAMNNDAGQAMQGAERRDAAGDEACWNEAVCEVDQRLRRLLEASQ